MHDTGGLWMLAVLGLLIVATALPVWALLIGVSSAFAAAALALGLFDLNVLSALPSRLLGLLEHDLLQALPLYVLVGVLLQRLAVADAVFELFAHLARRSGAGDSLAALGVGTLIAPMNGSVASSSALLSRLVGRRLNRLAAAPGTALVSVAATIGVVVPPSLVLILLGDAMLRAHTEASNLPGFALGSQRIINTQDLFRSALLPAASVLLLWALVAWWTGRDVGKNVPLKSMKPGQTAIALIACAVIVLLLAGVFSGRLLAVEAAASAGMLLVVLALGLRSLTRAQWADVLADTLTLSGALFALLVGASTFSLIFRLLGSDRWVADAVLHASWSPPVTAMVVLLLVAACAWVLDAFEMIFVIIPIVAPPLIFKLGDAQQAAVLLLLVLQLSFLMPPMGYAVLMARARSGFGLVRMGPLLWALWPYLAVQCAITVAVFLLPATVHQLDASAPGVGVAPLSNAEIEKAIADMSPPKADESEAKDTK